MKISFALLVALPLLCAAERRLPTSGIDAAQYQKVLKRLTSEDMRGRGTGRPELDRAAHYLATEFRRAGFVPASGSSYFQRFSVTLRPHLGPANSVFLSENGTAHALQLSRDYVPEPFSAAGSAAGDAVFCGYGITAPEYGYDDYAGIDVKGKIAVVLRHEPQEFDRDSLFEGRVYTVHGQTPNKVENAWAHGAAAIVIVNDEAAHSGSDQLEKFTNYTAPSRAHIPAIHMRAEAIESWFRSSPYGTLRELQQAIDRDLRPRSFVLPSHLHVGMKVDIHYVQRTVENVAAYLPGTTSEYVIIGAHYDHLGLGEQFSLAVNASGKPHPGADDNGSGTAGLVMLARSLGEQPKMRRGVLLVGFAGEELGLLGSNYYVHHPLLPVKNLVAMLNMDMIGRMKDRKLIVGGVRTGSTFANLLETASRQSELIVDSTDDSVYGSSDHTSFLPLRVPVLFFFTGLHADYHRPSDTWDKIDVISASHVLDLVGGVTMSLCNGDGRPEFVSPVTPALNGDSTSMQQQ